MASRGADFHEREQAMRPDEKMKSDEDRRITVKGWLIVSGLALIFLFYGLFIYFLVGDKGSPGWDFGTMADIPGESAYSTSPEPVGNVGGPEVQHVQERPPRSLEQKGGRTR